VPLKRVPPPTGLPAKLTICGTVWTVEYVEDMHRKKGRFGRTAPSQRLIQIATDQHPDLLRCTLLHEAMHAALRLGGVQSGIDRDAEEKMCSALEVPLLSLIRDNQVKW
jgi:hypothetical protein